MQNQLKYILQQKNLVAGKNPPYMSARYFVFKQILSPKNHGTHAEGRMNPCTLGKPSKEKTEIYWSFTNRGYPPIARIGKFPFFSSAIFLGGWSKLVKKMYSLFTCFWAYRSFLTYKCLFLRKKPEIYWSGGTPPPPSIDKRLIYFRFFFWRLPLT